MSAPTPAREVLDLHRPMHSIAAGRVVCFGCEWAAESPGDTPDGHAEHRGHLADLLDEQTRTLAAELEALRPAVCEMKHRPPMDFAFCETHDTTFALGQKCKYDGRDMWEVAAEEADEQRGLKMRALIDLDAARDNVAAYLAAHTGALPPQWAEVLGRVAEPLSAEDLAAWSVHNLPDGTVRP